MLATTETRVRNAFIAAILSAKDQNTLRELADLATGGRLMEAIEKIANTIGKSIASSVDLAFVDTGRAVIAAMSDSFAAVIDFDQVNHRAVSAMQSNRLRLIREFVQEQRRATREAITDAVRRGLNPRDTARAFRESIGLTARQQQAVNNFRRLLEQGSAEALSRQLRDRRFDRTVARAVRDKTPLTGAQIDRMVQRYNERFLKFRSEVIARTESLRAAHEGTQEAFRQAREDGEIEADTLEQTWVTAKDERVRDSHTTMNGQVRAMDEAFISGNGNLLKYPGDIDAPPSETIQCRCVVTTRVVRLPQV